MAEPREPSLATETEARLELVLQASEVLGRSLEFSATLASLATLLVPRMADGYVVDLVDDAGVIKRITAVDVDPANAPAMEALKKLGAVNPNAPQGIQKLLEAALPILMTEMNEESLRAGARSEEHLALMLGLGLRSGITVPLKSRGRAIGLLWLYYSSSKRAYTHDDLALIEEIAARAALAIDNARLFREAAEAVRARDDFLAIASHELRTPITALLLRVQGYQRLLNRHPEREVSSTELGEWLGAFGQQINRVTRLIDVMLDVSRMTAGRVDFVREPLDLGAIVQGAIASVEDEARKKGCAIVADVEPGVIGMWDRMRLEQVVVNLLSNAMKYGEGKPVHVWVRRRGAIGELEVKDAGIGIEPAHLERIFERFERMVSSRNYGGFGLGLWIVRQIVEAYGGTIRAESAPGAGARFFVSLPLVA